MYEIPVENNTRSTKPVTPWTILCNDSIRVSENYSVAT